MTEIIAVSTVAVTASSAAAIGSWAWIRGRQARQALRGGSRRAADFSPDRYQPMARLTGNDDIEFLRRRMCPRSGIVARWDRARRKVFGLYLNDLAQDFQGLHAEARALVSEAPEQYSDLVGLLMRQQIAFWRAMASVRVRFALNGIGIGQVDATPLVNALETMRQEIQRSIEFAATSA